MARPKIQLDSQFQASLKDASLKLIGVKKRAFIAKATQDYLHSSPRLAETYMGWSRKAVATGLKELQTGIVCQDNHQAKGRKKTEEKNPQLEEDIYSLVDEKSQAIDSKAKVRIGNFSRGGAERTIKAKKALDHDYSAKALLVPFGILDVLKDQRVI